MSLKNLEDVTYFTLNNQINIPVNGSIPLAKDKEAITAFFKENVEPNTFTKDTYAEKIEALLEGDYLEEDFIRSMK